MGGASKVACEACGLLIDLAQADTHAGQQLAALPPSLPVVRDYTGSTVGRFLLHECLGTGGMGAVYRAVDDTNGQVRAVKILFPRFGLQDEVVARFQREAKALGAIDHKNIVRFYEQGEDQGLHYLVMEYVEGINLDLYLKQLEPSPAEVLDIVGQISQALAHAHTKGIVHRDLKPANVIVSPDGVKVLDFGIAHMGVDELTLTHSDAMLGTFNYMAPEQRIGAKGIDQRADLFSLGVIFYRMLTGALPIGHFEPASRLNKSVGRSFDKVIARALHNDPNRRYQNVDEMLVDLAGLSRSGITSSAKAALAVASVVGVVGIFAAVISATDLGPGDVAPGDVVSTGLAFGDGALTTKAAVAADASGVTGASPDAGVSPLAALPRRPDAGAAGSAAGTPGNKMGNDIAGEKKLGSPGFGAPSGLTGLSTGLSTGPTRRALGKKKKVAKPVTRREDKTDKRKLILPAGSPLYSKPYAKSRVALTEKKQLEVSKYRMIKGKDGQKWYLLIVKGRKYYIPVAALSVNSKKTVDESTEVADGKLEDGKQPAKKSAKKPPGKASKKAGKKRKRKNPKGLGDGLGTRGEGSKETKPKSKEAIEDSLDTK